MLTLKAFGTLDVRDGEGEPLGSVLSQAKRAALLVYLGVARPEEMHRRDALLTLFWPESDDARGRNALSQALSFLRRELGDSVIVTRGTEEVGVDSEAITSDVRAFSDAMASGDWEGALDAYGGDLLQGLHVTSAAPFMDWVDRERGRLREEAADAGWRCAQERIAAGALTEAERAAQRALSLVPTDESRVRGFIQALADGGDRAAALRFYEKFRALLASELEVEPAPETVVVVEAIKERCEPVEVVEAPARPPVFSAPVDVDGAPTASTTPVATGQPRRSPRTRIAVAAATLLVLLVSYGIVSDERSGGPGTLVGQGLAEKYDQVVVADLTSSDASLGFTAAEWLRVALDQSDVIRPVSPAAIGAALSRMDRDPALPMDASAAREIAQRDGYPLVVAGEIEAVGSGYLITVRLEATSGREVLGRFRASARRGEELADALNGLSADIRRRIGESLRDIRRSPALEQVATPSLEALHLYSDAVRLGKRLNRPLDAIPLYERAVALDTSFAAAYFMLDETLNGLMTQWERQLALSRKAYEHRDRLPDYQALLAEARYTFLRLTQWADTTSEGPDACAIDETMVRLFAAYVRRHPEDPRPLYAYGSWQERWGRPREAIETFEKLVAMSPSATTGYYALSLAQMKVGRFEEARNTLDLWRERLGGSFPYLLLNQASLAAREGDYTATDSLEDAFVTTFGGDALGGNAMDRGDLDAVRGRMHEAWLHYDSGIAALEASGDRVAPLRWVTQRALLRLVVLGDTAGALADVRAAMARAPDTVELAHAWNDVALVHALGGDAGPVREALGVLEGAGRSRWALARARLAAALAARQGEPHRALDLVASAHTRCWLGPWQDAWDDDRLLRILAGRAYEAMNEPDSAIAEYEAYFADPLLVYPTPLDAVFVFDTLERLGRLHEALGDSAGAAGYYTRAAELWKDADPELQPRVKWLRARAAALGADARPDAPASPGRRSLGLSR